MRKSAVLAVMVAAAVVASLVATIPGAFAGGDRTLQANKWTSVIPSKKAVSGVWGGGCIAVAANDACSAAVTIFPNAPVVLEGQDMGVLSGLVENPLCAGDAESPSAPPGVLCLYINEADIVNVAKNGEGSWSVQPFPILDGKRGFLVKWNAAAAGASQIDGVWVYRAP
jgi:hypothetical protein